MNLHRIASLTSTVVLLAGVTAASVHAQTGVFSSATFTVTPGTGDIVGMGAGTFVGVVNSPATLTLTGTGSTANDVFGVITENVTNLNATIAAGGDTTTFTGASGTLTVTSGDLVEFMATTLGTTTTTYPGLNVTGLDFNFTATPAPAVTGGTVITPGLTLGGTLNGFSGTNGVVSVTFGSPVPEPGMVSMLVGLAVTGTGLSLRRMRRRSA